MDAEHVVEEVDELGVGEGSEASEVGPCADGVGDVEVGEGGEAPDAGPVADDVPAADDFAGVGGGAPAVGYGGAGVVWAAAAALGDAAGDERATLLRRQRELKDERGACRWTCSMRISAAPAYWNELGVSWTGERDAANSKAKAKA